MAAEESKVPKSLEVETPQSVSRRRHAKAVQANQAGPTIIDEWYEIRGKKLVRLQKTATGKHSTFVCNAAKDKEFVAGLKKKNLLRVAI